MTAGLKSIAQIEQDRQAALDAYRQRLLQHVQQQAALNGPLQISATLSDGNQTTGLNLPAHPTILSIVSWNVQTFEPTKALKNPLVNRVINRVLGALGADVCVLLEARAEPHVNMNAIETGWVGSGAWKAASDEDTESDEEPPDEYLGDDPEDQYDDQSAPPTDEPVDFAAIDGGDPLLYLQDASEQTGKLWRPPARIYAYEADFARYFRMVEDLVKLQKLRAKQKAGQLTKAQEADLKKLKRRREAYRDDPRYGAAKNASGDERSFASGYNFAPKMLKSLCVSGSAQSGAWLSALESDDFVPIRTYYELEMLGDDLKPGLADRSRVGVDNGRFLLRLKRCDDCDALLGVGECDACLPLGPLSTSLENLRQCIDAITFYRCTAEESYAVLLRQNVECHGPSQRGVWLAEKQVSVKTIASRLLARAPDELDPSTVQVVVGRALGFADGSSKFYGRCPYRMPLEIWLPGQTDSIGVPLVAFHGPFGKSTLEGIRIRQAAMMEILQGESGVLQQGHEVSIREGPFGIVLGDFNLDWAPTQANPSGAAQIANQLYQDFASEGFVAQIGGGIATSLISIHDRAQAWKQKAAPSDFTSSAYDNVFVKGQALRDHVANAAVVDVITYLADHADDFPLPDDDPLAGEAGSLSAIALAFYKYHKYVSDHLPVVLDLLVEAMPPGSPAALRVEAQLQAIRQAATRLPPQHVVVHFEALRSIERIEAEPHRYRIDPGSTEQDWTATWVGEVEAHQDDHLVVAYAFERDGGTDYARLACQPPGGTAEIGSFLGAFPVGSTVRVSTYRHRFVQ